MKKGKYIDILVIMACKSGKRGISNLEHVDHLLEKACVSCTQTTRMVNSKKEQRILHESI